MNWTGNSNELGEKINELFGGEIKWIGWYENYPTLPNHRKLSKSEKNKVTAGQILSNLKISSLCEGEGAKPRYNSTYIYMPIYFWKMYIFQKTWNTHNCFLLPISFFYEVPQKSIWLAAPDINMEEGHIPSCPLRTFLFRKCDLLHNFLPCKASATFCTIMVICKTHHPPLYKELKCTQEIPTTAALNLNFRLNFELKDFVL